MSVEPVTNWDAAEVALNTWLGSAYTGLMSSPPTRVRAESVEVRDGQPIAGTLRLVGVMARGDFLEAMDAVGARAVADGVWEAPGPGGVTVRYSTTQP